MLDFGGNKSFRLLSMYESLNKGEDICKSDLARHYGVSEKTIGVTLKIYAPICLNHTNVKTK